MSTPGDERSTRPDPVRPGPSRPTRVSQKGQVTVPKPVRDYLGLGAGSSVAFEVTDTGDVVLRKRPDTARPLRGLLAGYAPDGPAPSIEDLDAGIARETGRLDSDARLGAGTPSGSASSDDDA